MLVAIRPIPLALLAAGTAGGWLAAPASGATWRDPVTLTRAGDVQFDLAMGADGTAAAVWSRDGIASPSSVPAAPGAARDRSTTGASASVARPSA